MFPNRQDDLLNKLKNCIGSLKNQNANFQQNKTAIKPTYNSIKENYQQQQYHGLSQKINTNVNHLKPAVQTPLGSYNRQPQESDTTQMNLGTYAKRGVITDVSNLTFNNPKTKTDYEQRNYSSSMKQDLRTDLNERKYQYGSAMARKIQIKEQPIEEIAMNRMNNIRQDLISAKQQELINNRQYQVKDNIARRYSLMQNEKTQNRYGGQIDVVVNGNRGSTTTRNYQMQVEERKSILDSDVGERREKGMLSARKDGVVAHNSKKDSGIVKRDIKTTISTKQVSKPIVIEPTQPKQRERPNITKQLLTRAYEEREQEGQCSALAKLKKISELNQKINDRIRNIINVFQEHKC